MKRYPKVIAYIMIQRGEKVSEIIFKTIIGKGGKGEQGEQGISYEVPTNSIVAYDGSDLPAGWIECDAPEGFPGIARALGGVGKAGATTITESNYQETTLTLNGAEHVAEQLADLLGGNVEAMPATGNYTDCFLVYMTQRDLEFKTGVSVCGYLNGSTYQTSINRYINGTLKTDAGIYNGSLQSVIIDFIKKDNCWIVGTRVSQSSNLDIKLAYSKGRHLDDPTLETGVYSILQGQAIYTWCELFDEAYEQKQLITTPNDSVSLVPLVAELSRVKADNLYIITAMRSLDMGNKAFNFELDGDTFNTVSSSAPLYRRLAIKGA